MFSVGTRQGWKMIRSTFFWNQWKTPVNLGLNKGRKYYLDDRLIKTSLLEEAAK